MPFTPFTWHNFAVQVDWDNLTLGVFYSSNDNKLKPVTGVLQNPTASFGAAGQGDFHFGVLKVRECTPIKEKCIRILMAYDY